MEPNNTTITLDSSSVIRIILQFLHEQGLQSSVRALQSESNVALGALERPSSLISDCTSGRWDTVLSCCSLLSLPPRILSRIYEQIVRELIAAREIEAARAILRGAAPLAALRVDEPAIIARLEALVTHGASASYSDDTIENTEGCPGPARDAARLRIATSLMDHVETAPRGRLLALLGAAIKWNVHVGAVEPGASIDLLGASAANLGGGSGGTSGSAHPQRLTRDDALITTRASVSLSFGAAGAGGAPDTVFYSADGLSLIVGGRDGLIEVYDSRTGRLRVDLGYQVRDEYMLHEAGVTAGASARDGEMIATGARDGRVKVWRLATGECVRRFVNAGGGGGGGGGALGVSVLVWTRDASTLLAAGGDGAVRLLGLRSGQVLRELRGHNAYVSALSLLDTGSIAVSGGADGTLRVWDLKSGEVRGEWAALPVSGSLSTASVIASAGTAILSILTLPSIFTTTVAVNASSTPSFIVVPRARAAVALSLNGTICTVYELPNTARVGTVFSAAVLSPSGRWLYALTDDGRLWAWDVVTGTIATPQLEGAVHEAPPLGLVAHPIKSLLVTWAEDATLRTWAPIDI